VTNPRPVSLSRGPCLSNLSASRMARGTRIESLSCHKSRMCCQKSRSDRSPPSRRVPRNLPLWQSNEENSVRPARIRRPRHGYSVRRRPDLAIEDGVFLVHRAVRIAQVLLVRHISHARLTVRGRTFRKYSAWPHERIELRWRGPDVPRTSQNRRATPGEYSKINHLFHDFRQDCLNNMQF